MIKFITLGNLHKSRLKAISALTRFMTAKRFIL